MTSRFILIVENTITIDLPHLAHTNLSSIPQLKVKLRIKLFFLRNKKFMLSIEIQYLRFIWLCHECTILSPLEFKAGLILDSELQEGLFLQRLSVPGPIRSGPGSSLLWPVLQAASQVEG